MDTDKVNISSASRVLKNISNVSRLKILMKLAEKPMSVSNLNQHVKISQSALSQHLNILKLANVIDSKRSGTNVTYFIFNEEIFRLIKLICKTFSRGSKLSIEEQTPFFAQDNKEN